jgi:hypothetical protein
MNPLSPRDEQVETLVAAMAGMTIVDSHEHLPREEELLAEPADIFTRLFCQYSPSTIASAGLPDARARLKDTTIPLDERWRLFRPFLDAVRDTGYVRSAFRAARDLFGVDDISDATYAALSEKIRAADTPGLYERILREACHIERIINQGSWKDAFTPGMYRPFMYLPETDAKDLGSIFRAWEEGKGRRFSHAMDWATAWCADIAAMGYIGLKFAASIPPTCIEDAAADVLLGRLQGATITDEEARALGAWLMHASIRCAPGQRFVVAIHCGLNWEVNATLADKSPMNIVPLLLKYRSTVFDLYHGGIPWVREMAVIGNQYPNAHLNLCWSHQVSPYMAEHMINEWIDLVPSNKIIGFGGDVSSSPYKVYGALCFARENIARALAVRIRRGQMSESRAVAVCHAWLSANPKRIYGLS